MSCLLSACASCLSLSAETLIMQGRRYDLQTIRLFRVNENNSVVVALEENVKMDVSTVSLSQEGGSGKKGANITLYFFYTR